jgi:hypothetical protein
VCAASTQLASPICSQDQTSYTKQTKETKNFVLRPEKFDEREGACECGWRSVECGIEGPGPKCCSSRYEEALIVSSERAFLDKEDLNVVTAATSRHRTAVVRACWKPGRLAVRRWYCPDSPGGDAIDVRAFTVLCGACIH